MSDPKPLAADPLRQAVPAIRGYAAQIARTTLAWAELGRGEALYVEAAEDYDRVVQGGGAEAVQVREASENVTLSSRKVIEAIVHFWGHQRRNPGRTVSLRYLTTASRGREQGGQFGGQAGLDYWDSCRAEGTDLRPLRDHLVAKVGALMKHSKKRESEADRIRRDEWNATVAELGEVLRNGTDGEVRDRLLRRIVWETASPERPEVIRQLERLLVEYGERVHRATPAESKKVLSHLILQVWDKACEGGNRELTRADFAVAFEDAVGGVLVPLEEFKVLLAATTRAAAAALPAEPAASTWYKEAFRDRYAAAREASVAGRLDEANAAMLGLLESVRKTAPDTDAERRQFEQGILLTLSQNALRSADRGRSISLYNEATALGPLEGKNRHLAGWMLTNLGRGEDAIELLDPGDGSPQWQASLAIALIESGRLDRVREVLGEERDIDNLDVLLALTRHYTAEEDLVRAEHVAKRVKGMENGTPESRFQAVEAAFTVFQAAAFATHRPPVDIGYWMETLRHLFSDSAEVMTRAVPLLRLLVLRRRVEFYELVSEHDEVAEAFHQLVEAAPEMAAEVAAFGVMGPREVDLLAAREGARDPVHAAIIQAVHLDHDRAAALQRLRALESSTDGGEHEVLVMLILELAAAAGESEDQLMPRVAEIVDPINQWITRAAIRSASGDDKARETLDQALDAYPESPRLLRPRYRLARLLGPREEEVTFAERLHERLPVPEIQLLLAESRMRAGDVEGALRDAAEVEGGPRGAKAAYKAAEFAMRGRRMADHAAAARRFYEADGSPRACLYAAIAALRAREYGEAEKLYRAVIEGDERELLLSAYGGLAHAVDAQGGELSAAREQSIEVLLDGYDRLGAPPELAVTLYYRALGTRYATDAHERISRDFGSLADLPGMTAFPIEEALEMMRRDQEGAKLRTELLRAGVLPFEVAVELGHRRGTYAWFVHRHGRVLMVTEPPRVPSLENGAGLSVDPSPLLLDRTALLMLAETALLDTVLESRLALLIEPETYDWLEDEEQSLQSESRPIELERLRSLVEEIEGTAGINRLARSDVDEGLLELFRSDLSWGDAYELACAHRDDLLVLNDSVDRESVPQGERHRIIRSGDLLHALIAGRMVTVAEAAAAERERPNSFTRSDGVSVSLDRPFLITSGALEAWYDAGLLKTLARTPGAVVVSPIAERHVRDHLLERESESQALLALSQIRDSLGKAVAAGRVGVIEATAGEPESDEVRAEPEADAATTLLERVGGTLRRMYGRAESVSATLWSDDAAAHLYLDPFGPMISNAPEIGQLTHALRAAHPDLRVVDTPDVLRWMEAEGLLSREKRVAVLADLARHGRALVDEAAVLVGAADDNTSEAPSVLTLIEVMPSVLPPDVVRRFSPKVAKMMAAAFVQAWYTENRKPEDQQRTLRTLLSALHTWLAPGNPHSRVMAEMLWAALVAQLVERLDSEMEPFLRTLLELAAAEPARYRQFLSATWKAVDVLHDIAHDSPKEVRQVGGIVVARLAVASGNIEIDGHPILPESMVRLAADSFGLEGVLRHTAHYEGESDEGHKHTFTIDDDQMEEAAAHALNEWTKEPREPEAASVVPVEVPVVSDDRAVRSVFQGTVDAVRILSRLTPAAREFTAQCLSMHYREQGAAELAGRLEALASEMGSDDADTADAAHRQLMAALLHSPRLWAEFDSYRAFTLLRDMPLADLRQMAGSPEPWRAGEGLRERTIRRRKAMAGSEELIEDMKRTWGPFEVAVLQWLELESSADQAADTEEALRRLVHRALAADCPFDRVFGLGAALSLCQRRPDLGRKEAGKVEFKLIGKAIHLAFRGSVQELLCDLLTLWLQNELAVPAVDDAAADEQGDEQGEGESSLESVARVHALTDRLAVDVTRFAHRAVLSARHDVEAIAEVGSDSDRDAIGDLLLLGRGAAMALSPRLFLQAGRWGTPLAVKELEAAHEQAPLSEGRVPLREVFVPEALGVGGRGVNPYLAVLLVFLGQSVELLRETAAGASGFEAPAGSEVPAWWTEEVSAAVRALARRDVPPQVRYLKEVAHSEGVKDRFGSLLTPGVEGHAAALVALIEGGGGGGVVGGAEVVPLPVDG